MMTIIHEIHDDSNSFIIDILKNEFSLIDDIKISKNYNPKYFDVPGNLFFILKTGRFGVGKGKYYVLLDNNNKFIASAGWNQYELDNEIALVLTRAYIKKEYRAKYYLGNIILPLIISETNSYKKTWMTVNDHNINVYNWVDRNSKGKRPVLFNNWPAIYKKFIPIGIKNIYYTDQYVMEYIR